MSRRRSRRCVQPVTEPTVSADTRENLHRLLWSLKLEDVSALAESVAKDFIDELDPTSRERIDALIEGRLKALLGPAAGRWAAKMLEEYRGKQQ